MTNPVRNAIGIFAAGILTAGLVFAFSTQTKASQATPVNAAFTTTEPAKKVTEAVASSTSDSRQPFTQPISDALSRVTKKTFGLKIVEGQSPVPNDRFHGFHVGVDFETVEAEKDIDVPISAICTGPLLFKEYAGGYGGLAVQRCALDGKDISIIYGHLKLASVNWKSGDLITQGEQIGVLGQGYSQETDGVRKHLHLGVFNGTKTDIRGYVQSQDEIGMWLDPLKLMSL